MNLVSTAARVASGRALPGLPGLPAVRLSDAQRRQRNVANPRLAATRTRLNGPRGGAVPVTGQPSMRLIERDGGGVVTELVRKSNYTDFLTDSDLAPLVRELTSIERSARALSRGPLSLARLRAMGHPYGRGARRDGRRRGGLGRLQGSRQGVSNLAVVNAQSGRLARSWSSRLERQKGGVALRLENSAPQSRWVAMGTKKLRAHGPFTSSLARRLPAINREWAAAARKGQARAQELERMAQEGGMG